MSLHVACQEPFDPVKCTIALTSGAKAYKASVNIWSINLTNLPVDVPLLNNAVTKFREHHFKFPAVLPMDVVCVCESPQQAITAVSQGSLRQVSAPEIVFSYIEAVFLDLNKADEDLNAKWRATMLCCPVIIRLVDTTDAVHRLSIQYREDLAQAFASLRYTAVQKMFDMKVTMDRKSGTTGPMSAAQVAAYYKDIKFAENSEVVSTEFVDCAMTVLKRLWSIPRCAELILKLEEQGTKNPMDSIYKLHKAPTQTKLLPTCAIQSHCILPSLLPTPGCDEGWHPRAHPLVHGSVVRPLAFGSHAP